MDLSIRLQAVSLLLACALGMGLGLLYDLLRPIRRRSGDFVWDLLFCFCAAVSAFLFAMRSPAAVLGTVDLLLALFGLLAYFHLLSPVLLPVFGKIDRAFGVFWINTQNRLKKVAQTAKKLFQKKEE